ncbi:hypothetical protein P389DRAFT_24040 [Cystobasidium minutum MCA 4210]|uniref:uncharacterized protein n=1 Tax=Cystobasidium minutum MCA 4210 TaxID=1397322 RepID=UPI0034CEE652|eukprot:jgi/Rhomi1/24040/CE24039_1303
MARCSLSWMETESCLLFAFPKAMLIGNRNVGAERYKPESTARKSLFGVYRNPFTHHPYVQAVLESTANTNVVIHAGELLALKENGPAYEMDHDTLVTKGYNPFKQSSKTFTAHPKLDSLTGNLVGFGYEAVDLQRGMFIIPNWIQVEKS